MESMTTMEAVAAAASVRKQKETEWWWEFAHFVSLEFSDSTTEALLTISLAWSRFSWVNNKEMLDHNFCNYAMSYKQNFGTVQFTAVHGYFKPYKFLCTWCTHYILLITDLVKPAASYDIHGCFICSLCTHIGRTQNIAYLTPCSMRKLTSPCRPPGRSLTHTVSLTRRLSAASPRSRQRPNTEVSMLPPDNTTTTLHARGKHCQSNHTMSHNGRRLWTTTIHYTILHIVTTIGKNFPCTCKGAIFEQNRLYVIVSHNFL